MSQAVQDEYWLDKIYVTFLLLNRYYLKMPTRSCEISWYFSVSGYHFVVADDAEKDTSVYGNFQWSIGIIPIPLNTSLLKLFWWNVWKPCFNKNEYYDMENYFEMLILQMWGDLKWLPQKRYL